MFRYYLLLSDDEFNRVLVKKNIETREEKYFNPTNNNWEAIGIMIRYFWPDSDTYDMYEELTEEEAMEIVSM
ncbi:hypothetical protein CL176_01390 [Suicoccus acidiformans]|uniref:Uncharacterized protein n=1 Tax=Suicoccus acidiformans TaxID=2036206 RepID=A0A347WI68_9LACT|nr:hypothetical protein [Suicoccus acidiformans]AXY24775.1 hypothetical protein CL176_01390 [Suicoccus acidiformans]